ncbi:hypothetical protein GJ744_012067 [Endocarpon pusillum]|uniref:Uncharacterized protein n=1 Tax=Endocarpon pusillum TaxID=364733 RepID=A0A8H7E0N6_9EURO|nr:hypothetical protein GJ744_012067 [Endocarpon pusillum]
MARYLFVYDVGAGEKETVEEDDAFPPGVALGREEEMKGSQQIPKVDASLDN